MNDDLGRALNDLADAAARTASRGIVAEPSVGPTVARLTTAVRRRRAAKTAGAGLLALALVAVTASAVSAGLDRGTTLPPVVTPTVTTRAPSPTITAPSPSPTGTPLSGLVCGASDEAISEMSDPVAHPPLAGITAPALAATPFYEPLPTTFTIDNFSAAQMAYLTMQPRLVVLQNHVIVGWGLLVGGSRGPAMAGGSTDAFMKDSLVACDTDVPLFHQAGARLGPGDYEVVALVDATPVDGGAPVTAVGGPFALTLTDPGTYPSLASPIDEYFPCGQAPTVSERNLPDVEGVVLAAAPAPNRSSAIWSPWNAVLTGADDRTITGQIVVAVRLVFVDSNGLVAGIESNGDFEWRPFAVSSGSPITVPGGGEPIRCDDSTPAPTDLTVPPGTYTAWPFTFVTITGITHPDGTTDPAPIGDHIVIGTPSQVTFSG